LLDGNLHRAEFALPYFLLRSLDIQQNVVLTRTSTRPARRPRRITS
jgi:hypothetical protein